jgi:thioesterase domain-containing protein
MPGSDRLQQRLAACGLSSTISCGAAAHAVSRRILERRARGNPCPIVLMGYATGGGGVKTVAEDLARHGLCVDAIILLDPSFFEPVPRNVRYCFVAYRPEVWQSWNSIMRGNPVRTESPRTVVRLVNLEESDSLGLMQTQSHLTITLDDWVQEILVQQAAAAFCCDGIPRSATRETARGRR